MKVKVGVSARHIHLTAEDFKLLFGNIELTKRNDLSQPGQFASNLVVSIEGPKKRIDNVRILGPLRNYTQAEVSKTDSYILGINPPVRDSGDLFDAEMITIINNENKIERKCCIIPTRHIHISNKQKELLNLDSSVKVKISSEKGGILDNVHVKASDMYDLELHLDTDDANSHLLNQNDEVEII